MAEKRKDMKGRNLRTGEYYDEKNQRYMFRKMVAGNRITIDVYKRQVLQCRPLKV